jgi:ABC-2 type transport system ATP-binding protein
MKTAAISARAIGRTFDGRPVLRDVGFDLPFGATMAIVGANGSGKTTLLEILATLLWPTSGRAAVFGRDVVREAVQVRRLVGYGLSNLNSFYPQLSARQNLELMAAVHGLPEQSAKRRTIRLLEAVGLEAAADRRVQGFSDGMKARLSMARALIADPPVLLLDEPTKSLDDEVRPIVRGLAAAPTETRAPRTVVWTTHDAGEAAAIADCVFRLEDGELRPVRRLVEQAACPERSRRACPERSPRARPERSRRVPA